MIALVLTAPLFFPQPAPPTFQKGGDVPVTIKELDLAGALAEFRQFQTKLSEYRDQIGEGRKVAQETSQILAELRSTATAENGYNEEKILSAVGGYVDGVLAKQVGLVDFLESQRYRISYYANKMASSVRPEDLAILFGSVQQNDVAIASHVRSLDASQRGLADFVDGLPKDQFDPLTFKPTRTMPRETRQKLDALLYRYQQERNGLDLAKKRLQLVRAAERNVSGTSRLELEIDSDLLVGQMFGALDRVRLQMSMDLMFLEQLLEGYARTSRTQDVLEAFASLVEMQGDLEGPSPELSSVLDWLQDSSIRRLSISSTNLKRSGLQMPRYSDLLREAYQGARGAAEGTKP